MRSSNSAGDMLDELNVEDLKDLGQQLNVDTEPKKKSKYDPLLRRFHLWTEKKGEKPSKPRETIDLEIIEDIMRAEHIFTLGGKAYIYTCGYYKADLTGNRIKELIRQRIYRELINARRVTRIYDLLIQTAAIEKQLSDVNRYPPTWINFRNGMLDPLTLELHDHDPKYLSINQLPHIWDPNYIVDASSPVARFLGGLMPDSDDLNMLLEYAGYCMTLGMWLQKFLYIKGPGGLGKSEVIGLVEELIGEENRTSMPIQYLAARFSTINLLGKLLNSCADVSSEAMSNIGTLKIITGQDTLRGEYKGGAEIYFRPYCKLIFSANRIPESTDDKTDAYYRRILVLDIRQRAPEIPDLHRKLQKDIQAFLHLSVMAFHDMLQRGGQITESERSREAVAALYKETDSVQAFLEDNFEPIRSEGQGQVERGELYRQYETFCTDEGRPPRSKNSFYAILRDKGYGEKVINGRRCIFPLTARFQPDESSEGEAIFGP